MQSWMPSKHKSPVSHLASEALHGSHIGILNFLHYWKLCFILCLDGVQIKSNDSASFDELKSCGKHLSTYRFASSTSISLESLLAPTTPGGTFGECCWTLHIRFALFLQSLSFVKYDSNCYSQSPSGSQAGLAIRSNCIPEFGWTFASKFVFLYKRADRIEYWALHVDSHKILKLISTKLSKLK